MARAKRRFATIHRSRRFAAAGKLNAQRSVLSIGNFNSAIETRHHPRARGQTFIVKSDPVTVTVHCVIAISAEGRGDPVLKDARIFPQGCRPGGMWERVGYLTPAPPNFDGWNPSE